MSDDNDSYLSASTLDNPSPVDSVTILTTPTDDEAVVSEAEA